MKWFLIILFTVQIYSQQAKNVVIEDYERCKQKLENGETLIFKNLRKEYWLILALMLSASSQGQILMNDKGYNPPADVFPPSVPSNLTLTPISEDTIKATWSDPPEGDLAKIYIRQGGVLIDSINPGVKQYYVGTRLGGELCTDGTFSDAGSWTLASGATIGSGTLNCVAVDGANYEDLSLEVGKTYEMTYTVVSYTGGSVVIQCGGTGGIPRSSEGTFTERLLRGGNSYVNIVMGGFTGTLDNVSVKEVISLAPYTHYYFDLRARDNNYNYSAYCDTVGATTYDTTTSTASPPEMPTNLTVADSLDDITLTWTNNPPNASNIVIMKNNADYDTVAYPIATWTESDTTDGVYNTYKIYAYNAGGESDTSSTVTAERYSSDTRYVSNGGNNSNSGTNPNLSWQTTGKINSEWLSGLTVKIKSGDTLSDAALVTQSNVAYSMYGGSERAIIRLPSLTSTDFVVDNYDKDYVTLANLEIIGRLYVNFKSSSYLKIKNIYAHHYNTTDDQYMAIGLAPMYGDYTSDLYLEIKNSIIIGGFPTDQQVDLFNLTRSSKYYIHDNYLANITHSIFGTNRGWDGIIEHNRVYNAYHSGLNLQVGDSNMVVRYNYFERSGIGSNDDVYNEVDKDMGYIGLSGLNHIFGFNIVKYAGAQRAQLYNYLPAIEIFSGIRENYQTTSSNQRIYNNDIYNTYGTGIKITLNPDGVALANNKIFNNVLVKANDTSWYPTYTSVNADSAMIMIEDNNTSVNPSGNLVDFNYLGAKDTNLCDISNSATATNTASWTGYTFENNLSGGSDVDVFAGSEDDSITNYTYWIPTTIRGNLYDTLASQFGGSGVLVDAGRPHAYVSGNQTNDSILVTDVYPFFRGISGLKDGDSVYINGDRLKIIAIDYTNSKLVFDTSVTVLDGEGVYLINPYTHDAYKESAIDIGLE